LIFKGILIGCSSNIVLQAKELNGFIRGHLSSGDNVGSTIVFYSKIEEKNQVLGLVPTEFVKLVRVTRYQPENILQALQAVENAEKTHLYIFPSGNAGSELAVRWSCRMKGSCLAHVKQIECSETQLIARKKVYANNVLGSFKLTKKPYCISLTKGCADSQAITKRDKLTITEYDLTDLQNDPFIKQSKWIPTETTRDLETTTFLVVGGRGMRNKENTESLKKMADAMGADFGVSRPVAMNAWASMNRIIGVSGTMTKPEVCIAAGVSGAAANYAGIEKSKTIIAINTDIHAPIIKASDVVIIDDYKAVMEELVKIVLN